MTGCLFKNYFKLSSLISKKYRTCSLCFMLDQRVLISIKTPWLDGACHGSDEVGIQLLLVWLAVYFSLLCVRYVRRGILVSCITTGFEFSIEESVDSLVFFRLPNIFIPCRKAGNLPSLVELGSCSSFLCSLYYI